MMVGRLGIVADKYTCFSFLLLFFKNRVCSYFCYSGQCVGAYIYSTYQYVSPTLGLALGVLLAQLRKQYVHM